MEEHARYIQTLLPATRIELQEILSLAGKDRLAHVLTDIWPSYINTFFSKQDVVGRCPVSPEARSFHRNLSLVEHFGILQACKDKYALNMASCLAKDEAKETLYQTLPRFFAADHVSYFLWYKLAVQAQLLPAGLDNFMTLDCLQQRATIEGEQTKREQACGSRWPYLDAYEGIDVSCKFAGLFLPMSEDARRYTFLNDCGGDADLSSIPSLLRNIMETHLE